MILQQQSRVGITRADVFEMEIECRSHATQPWLLKLVEKQPSGMGLAVTFLGQIATLKWN